MRRPSLISRGSPSISLLALLLAAPICLAQSDFAFVHASDPSLSADPALESRSDIAGMLWDQISALEPQPAFVITTGNLTESGRDDEYAAFASALQLLAIDHHEAPGNQDVRAAREGKESFARGTGQPLYRAWDAQGIHFIRLDSTIPFHTYGHVDQAQLDWLKRDLRKLAPGTPVVVALHHWVGRDRRTIDNEAALLEALAGVNVRLWLTGEGRADLAWNVNGAAALMVKPLFQGSYHLVSRQDDDLVVRRHQWAGNAPPVRDQTSMQVNLPESLMVDVATIDLAPLPPPDWSVDASASGNRIDIVARGDLPADASLSCRIDDRRAAAMARGVDNWTAAVAAHEVWPGQHEAIVRATLADGRIYEQTVPLSIPPSTTPGPRWSIELGQPVQAGIAQRGKTWFVATMAGDVVAIAADGAEQWRVRAGGAICSTPAVDDEALYVGCADGSVWAVDHNTRQTRWRYAAPAAVFSGPVVAGETVAVAAADDSVVGLDRRSGQVKWTAAVGGMVNTPLASDGKNVYVMRQDGALTCIAAADGTVAWTKDAPAGVSAGAPAGRPLINRAMLYATPGDGSLVALHASAGNPAWRHAGRRAGGGSPVVLSGRLYAALGEVGQLTCLDAASGQVVWQSDLGASIPAAPAATTGGIYVPAADGTIHVLDPGDGRVLWRYRLGRAHLLSAPAASEHGVAVAAYDGQVCGFAP